MVALQSCQVNWASEELLEIIEEKLVHIFSNAAVAGLGPSC